MSLIAYAMAGEGRGHAARAKSVTDELLSRGHSVVFLTNDDALRFLGECYEGEERVKFIQIPVLHITYARRGDIRRVNPWATVRDVAKFLRALPRALDKAEQDLRERNLRPEAMLCDFEPLSARLAPRLKIPLVTLDSQHFFRHTRMLRLPPAFWPSILFLRINCKVFVPRKDMTLISKFSPLGLVRETPKIRMIGPLVRDEIRKAVLPPQPQDFVLCYVRDSIAGETLKALERIGCRAVIYGLGAREAKGNFIYKELSASGFVEDLLQCRCVVSTAGSQLIGECISLRKPLFVFPEKGHFEQVMNARLATPLGVVRFKKDMERELRAFLEAPTPPRNPYEGDCASRAADALMEVIANTEGAKQAAASH